MPTPVATTFSPIEGLPVGRLDPIELRFSGSINMLHQVVVRFDDGVQEVAFQAMAFQDGYSRRSGRSLEGAENVVSLARRGGWRTPRFQISVVLLDSVPGGGGDAYPVIL